MSENKNNTLKIVFAVLMIAILIVGGYWAYLHFWGAKPDITNNDDYTCPMHQQISSDRPGQCPICGRDLVKRSSLKGTESQTYKDSTGMLKYVKFSPSQQVLANVQTVKVKTMEFAGEKTFNGYVKMNEKGFSHIATPVSGKIVNMYVNFEGQSVSKGQPVLEIYSPELVSTQKEYLLALDNLHQVESSGHHLAVEQAESLCRLCSGEPYGTGKVRLRTVEAGYNGSYERALDVNVDASATLLVRR